MDMDKEIMKLVAKVQAIAEDYLDLHANEGDQISIEFEQFDAPNVSPDDSINILCNNTKQFSINQEGDVSLFIEDLTYSDVMGIAKMADAIVQADLVKDDDAE